MNTLQPNKINSGISLQLFTTAKRLVEINHAIDKSCFFEDYYFRAVIEVNSVKQSKCSILLLNEDRKKYYCEDRQFDLSFLPPVLIKRMVRQSKLACHVLIQKRITIQSTYNNLKSTLIVPVGEKDIGYFSNHVIIDEEGQRYLQRLLNEADVSWLNRPQPRYKNLLELKKQMQDKLTKARAFYHAILNQHH